MYTLTADQLAVSILARYSDVLDSGGTPEKMENLRRKIALLATMTDQTFEQVLEALRAAMQ